MGDKAIQAGAIQQLVYPRKTMKSIITNYLRNNNGVRWALINRAKKYLETDEGTELISCLIESGKIKYDDLIKLIKIGNDSGYIGPSKNNPL